MIAYYAMETAMRWVYVVAAVVPAIILLTMIYKQDKIEKEPAPLLVALVLAGIGAAFIAIVLEMIGEAVLPVLVSPNTQIYYILLAFLVVAAAEEGAKYFLMKKITWENPAFDYRFDAIVYAAFVSLGFAAFENVGYVFSYGLSVAVSRAILSVPGHLGFSVFMGYFYGRARLAADLGQEDLKKKYLRLSYLSAVFVHGFYDSCCMIGTPIASLLFVVFVIAMYVVVFRLVRKESRTDQIV